MCKPAVHPPSRFALRHDRPVGLADSTIQRIQRFRGFNDSKIQGFEDSRIQGFEDEGFKDEGFKDEGFKDEGFAISD